MRRSTLLLILAVTALVGCSRLSGLFRNERPKIEEAYGKFREAMLKADIEGVKRLMAKETSTRALPDMAGPDLAMKLKLAAAIYPAPMSVNAVEISGSKATLTVSGPNELGPAQGTIQLVKEDGEWKVVNESWRMQFTGDAGAPTLTAGSPGPTRPDSGEFRRLRGQWLGPDVGTGAEWRFSFGDGFAVVVTNAAGQRYEGLAAFHFELGAEKDGSLRVRPGSGVLDVDVIQGSSREFDGKTSLGAYYLQGPTELKLCLSRPGVNVRVQSYDSTTDEVNCFHLTKISDEPIASRFAAAATDFAPPAAAESPAAGSAPPPPPRASSSTDASADATGEAEVTMDGTSSRYVLRTGWFYDTRFKDPRKATVQFQPAVVPTNNLTSGLLITLDATQIGRHYADGKPAKVGQDTPNGRAAELQWIAPGGQIFPAKTGCIIEVTSAYAGTAASVFAGEISQCTVFSAGTDHVLSSVRFTMRGSPSR